MSQAEKILVKEAATSNLKPFLLDASDQSSTQLIHTLYKPKASTSILNSSCKPATDESNFSINSTLSSTALKSKELSPSKNKQSTNIESTISASKSIKNDSNNIMSSVTGREIYKNIVDDLNKKRANDETISTEFHACINEWATECSSKIIASLYKKLQENSMLMSQKFELIEKDLDLIVKLEQELKLISNQVESLYNEIKNST